MAQRVGIEVSLAIAEAAKLSRVDVVSAYPITPQTHIVEHLAELVAEVQVCLRVVRQGRNRLAVLTSDGRDEDGPAVMLAHKQW